MGEVSIRCAALIVCSVLVHSACAVLAPCDIPNIPKTCTCVGTSVIECTNSNLDPDTSNKTLRSLPSNLVHLFFSGNNIPHIGDNMFGTSVHLNKLEFIVLANNHIETISGRAFHRVPNLRELHLDDNQWDLHGTHKVFSNIHKLQVLSLDNAFMDSHNISRQLMHLNMVFDMSMLTELHSLSLQRNYIPQISLDLHLPKLQHLDLSNNDLSMIDVKAANLKELVTLNLANNSIAFLNSTVLKEFTTLSEQKLTQLDLRKNKFICNCYLEPFYNWLKEANEYVVLKNKITCWAADQEKFRGMPIVMLKKEDFTCTPTPDIPAPVESSVIVLSVILAVISLLFIMVMYMNREKLKYRFFRISASLRESMSTNEGYSSVKA